MFAKPRAKPIIAPPSKKRKRESAIEEISFDPSAREDYLTGFHKRKLQRIKHAKEEAAKREKEEKVTARKILRENRRADLEKHVEAVNSMLRKQAGEASESSGEETVDKTEQWEGIAEEDRVDHEDAYVDDDRFTMVTVEAVDVSKRGLHKAQPDVGEESDAMEIQRPEEDSVETSNGAGAGSGKTKRMWSKEPPTRQKKKKKKFRYESKAERKITRYMEKSGNKAKAKARKSK